ncbi:hypothetical protein D6833_09245, partial [Candidatus Parcubacteria bacterium]
MAEYLEKLRDMLECLRHDAEFLYRYGDLASSLDLFRQLDADDKRRLIALALIEGDEDTQNVARYLMRELRPRPANLEELKSQLSPKYRAEVETYGQEPQPIEMTEGDKEEILEELWEACRTMGTLDVEEAYWVLIPETVGDDIVWIEAMGGEYEFYEKFRSPFEIGYKPGEEDFYELLESMREAQWVLHIHNHPGPPSVCLPSAQDFRTAFTWKSVRPRFACKMKFFVVQS